MSNQEEESDEATFVRQLSETFRKMKMCAQQEAPQVMTKGCGFEDSQRLKKSSKLQCTKRVVYVVRH